MLLTKTMLRRRQQLPTAITGSASPAVLGFLIRHQFYDTSFQSLAAALLPVSLLSLVLPCRADNQSRLPTVLMAGLFPSLVGSVSAVTLTQTSVGGAWAHLLGIAASTMVLWAVDRYATKQLPRRDGLTMTITLTAAVTAYIAVMWLISGTLPAALTAMLAAVPALLPFILLLRRPRPTDSTTAADYQALLLANVSDAVIATEMKFNVQS